MEVQVVGCGDAFGSGGRSHACFLLQGTSGSMLLDCGPSSVPAMKRLGIRPASLDAVVVSHLHGDHFGGIPFLFLEHRYLDPRERPLCIAGPPGLERRVAELGQTFYASGAAGSPDVPLHFVDLEPGKPHDLGFAQVRPFAVRHDPAELCMGFEVEVDGKKVVYSGDTEWFDGLVDAARGADLLLLECSYVEESGGHHVRLDDVLRNRERLECARLLLVHMGPAVLEQRQRHDLPWAEDGLRLEL